MKQRTIAVLIVVPLFALLVACGTRDGDAGTTPSQTTQGTKPADVTKPCQFVTAEDLVVALGGGTFKEVVASSSRPPITPLPPAAPAPAGNACTYEGVVNGTTVTIHVVISIDDGSKWKAGIKEAETVGGYRPVSGVGDDAFFRLTSNIRAIKGKVIVGISSPDDVRQQLTDQVLSSLAATALGRLSAKG